MNPTHVKEVFGADWSGWILGIYGLVVAAAVIEGLVRSRFGQYDWRAFFSTMGDTVGRFVLGSIVGLSIAAPVYAFALSHRLTTVALDHVSAFVLLFLGQEFCYYWYHRAAHRVRWFWATHSVHHSPNELTLAAAMRLGWTGKITGTALFFAPLVWLGFPPTAVIATLTLNLLYQFWVHATWIPKLGPLEWVLNTPSHHRVHHGSNPEYLDCNYGGVLIVFDRLFGTFVEERDDIQIRYGLTTPLTTYNPVRIALHEWTNLAGDLLKARSIGDVASALFGPPRAPVGKAATAPPVGASTTRAGQAG